MHICILTFSYSIEVACDSNSILFIPPQIPPGIRRNGPESSGMDRNPQELD
jgi:hypothetical protein